MELCSHDQRKWKAVSRIQCTLNLTLLFQLHGGTPRMVRRTVLQGKQYLWITCFFGFVLVRFPCFSLEYYYSDNQKLCKKTVQLCLLKFVIIKVFYIKTVYIFFVASHFLYFAAVPTTFKYIFIQHSL